MELYLVRHGIAVDIGEHDVKNDEERFLSPKGEKRTAQTAKALAKLNCALAVILSSPLSRAVQTARIVAKILSPRPELVEVAFLKPKARIAAALRELRALPHGSILLVGHMPHLSRLASAILTGDENALSVDFDKSGVCRIDGEGSLGRGAAQLKWLLDSEHCRCMAKGK